MCIFSLSSFRDHIPRHLSKVPGSKIHSFPTSFHHKKFSHFHQHRSPLHLDALDSRLPQTNPYQMENVGTFEEYLNLYNHVFLSFQGHMGKYLGNKLLGYSPKGTRISRLLTRRKTTQKRSPKMTRLGG